MELVGLLVAVFVVWVIIEGGSQWLLTYLTQCLSDYMKRKGLNPDVKAPKWIQQKWVKQTFAVVALFLSVYLLGRMFGL